MHKYIKTSPAVRTCEKCGIRVEKLEPQPPRKRGGYGWWLEGGKAVLINGRREASGQVNTLKEVPECGAANRPVDTLSTSLLPETGEPGRLSPSDDVKPWELDPETLMGDGNLREGDDPDSLIHNNRIHAASGLRALRAHGSPAEDTEQALTDVLVDLFHLGDLLGADPGWVDDAREHHRKEIVGEF